MAILDLLLFGLLVGIQIFLHRLNQYLHSPAWFRKRLAYGAFCVIPILRLIAIYRCDDVSWWDVLYVSIGLLAFLGIFDSNRILLKDVRKVVGADKQI